MKSKILILFLSVGLINCANLEFVYKMDKGVIETKNSVVFSVSGDDYSDIKNYITRIFGEPSESPMYRLIVSSKKFEKAEVIEGDATASKFKIEYEISYNFYNLEKNCKIIDSEIITQDSYYAKSAGYSFGTDLSKNETAKTIRNNNVDQFISSLNKKSNLDDC